MARHDARRLHGLADRNLFCFAKTCHAIKHIWCCFADRERRCDRTREHWWGARSSESSRLGCSARALVLHTHLHMQ
jgi:hypothetical protein